MGTNFYFYEKPTCGECKRPHESLHIGKSSMGWMFSLKIYPEAKIWDLPDWEKKWAIPGSYIEDEYGSRVSPEIMREWIANRPAGHRRHPVDGKHILAPGDGTWDLVLGEFS